jgi:hypothetical protein
MRRLPLAVGYKTKLPVTIEQVVHSQLELAVTGIEPAPPNYRLGIKVGHQLL